MNEKLLDILDENLLHQMQHQPTRLNSVLDLFCINKPDLVKEGSVTPGLSDHAMVVVDTHLPPEYKPQNTQENQPVVKSRLRKDQK